MKQNKLNNFLSVSLFCAFFVFKASAQLIFTNNTFNHIVMFNPAFSGIKPGFNRNYLDNCIQLSSRTNSKQSDITTSYQTFLNRSNIGVSAYASSVFSKPNINLNVGIGTSYQLIFFDEITTSWGINANFHHYTKSDNKELYFPYSTLSDTSQFTNSTDLTIGNLISYNNFILGFSTQPKRAFFNLEGQKQNHFTLSTFYFKTLLWQLSRQSNVNLWVNCNYYQFINESSRNQFNSKDLLYTSVQFHVFSSGSWLIGAGFRFSNDKYFSGLGKIGLHMNRVNLTYGIEPYYIKGKFQSVINEFSFTFNLNR